MNTEQNKEEIYVQLYSVRELFKDHPVQVLQQLQSLGFAGVEPAVFDFSKVDVIVEAIQGSSLKVSSVYTEFPAENVLPGIKELAQKLGVQRIVCGLQESDCACLSSLKHACEVLNNAAAFLSCNDMELCIHNHWWELAVLEDETVLEHMVRWLSSEITFEVDYFWARKGGFNFLEINKILGERIRQWHVKDGLIESGEFCAVGQGEMKWGECLPEANDNLLVLEIDKYHGDIFEVLQDSLHFVNECLRKADITQQNLKKRFSDHETIMAPFLSLTENRGTIKKCYVDEDADMVFIDLQHSPMSEYDLMSFCEWSTKQGVPVLLRIRSPHEAHMIGRYCDFGAMGIIIPMTEEVETVRTAVKSFYYLGQGQRSWGPGSACQSYRFEGFDYKDWWNKNGVLGLQFETVKAIRNCKDLCMEGVDIITFGGADLTLSLANTPECEWESVDECIQYVAKCLEGRDVRVIKSHMPFGKL